MNFDVGNELPNFIPMCFQAHKVSVHGCMKNPKAGQGPGSEANALWTEC